MQIWHQVMGLLCGALMIAGSAGCAGNGLVARQPTSGGRFDAAPERLVSIAQTFERQGRLKQADSMYRMALHRDPSNEVARTQIAHIASLTRTRTFPASGSESVTESEVMLVADVPGRASFDLTTAQVVSSAPDAGDDDADEIPTLEFPTAESLAADARESLMQTLNPAPETVQNSGLQEDVRGVARLRPVEPGSQLTPMTNPSVLRRVNNRQISAWMKAPARHVEPLLATLRTSPDGQQRALAATLLAEAPAGDSRVNSALQDHCQEQDASVAAAAGDSLLARGAVNETSVNSLLMLSEHSSVVIRNQVSSSIRRLAGTSWEGQAVQTLTARLNDSDPAVRGMAALALGDFSGEADVILNRLLDRYKVETDSGVRASLELAAQRIAALPVDGHTSGAERS